MPIVGDHDEYGAITPNPVDTNKPAPVATISVADPEYKDVVNDTRWSPVASIMTHVSGSRWSVNYYAQVINTDSQLMSQSPTTSGVYQQYKLIKGLCLRVQTPLAQNQDTDTKMMQIDGSAIVFGGIVPNEGDMFTADIGVKQHATFRVTETKKNSIYKEATYEISYAMSSADEHYIQDLEEKTIARYYWREDFITRGHKPLILESEAHAVSELQKAYRELCDYYFPTFFSNEYKTMVIPLQEYSTYDPFLAKFIADHFSNSDHHLLQKYRVLNLGSDRAVTQPCIWDAIAKQSRSVLKHGFTKVGMVWTSQFSGVGFFNGIKWTGILQCVYPTNPRIGYGLLEMDEVLPVNANGYNGTTPYTFYADEHEDPDAVQRAYNAMPPEENAKATYATLDANGNVAFPGVGVDDHYVFSEHFYQDNEPSILEAMVLKYLDEQELDVEQLIKTAEVATEWGVLEQVYYIPILLMMIRSTIEQFHE